MAGSSLGFSGVSSFYKGPSTPCVSSHICIHSSSSSSSSSSSRVSSSFHWVKNTTHPTKLNLCFKDSAPGIPMDLEDEDSKFVPLSAEDPQFGPPTLLLLGFQLDEAYKIRQLLKELDGEFMEIIFCTEEMITRSLWEAVNTRQPDLESLKIAHWLPRICFLSGLSGEEMMTFIDAFPETGLEPAVFAALVPNSADKAIQELIEEIMGDHEMLVSEVESRRCSYIYSFDMHKPLECLSMQTGNASS